MAVCKFFQQGNCRYGQSCRFDHIYGSKYSYRASQTQNQTHQDEFSNRTRQGSTNNAASSLFRSAVQNTSVFSNPINSNVFGQKPTSSISVFDRLGPPQNGFQNSQAKSLFAQANQNVFGQPQPANMQIQNAQAAKTIFSQNSQSIFGPVHPNVNIHSRDAANLFASAERSLHQNQQNISPFNNAGNVFQITENPTSNVFTQNVFDNDSDLTEGIYSKLEDLSQMDLKAFESSDFKLGYIPELPPPKSLCL